MSGVNPLEMSDDDFLQNYKVPLKSEAPASAPVEPVVESASEKEPTTEEDKDQDQDPGSDDAADGDNDEANDPGQGDEDKPEGSKEAPATPDKTQVDGGAVQPVKKDGKPDAASKSGDQPTADAPGAKTESTTPVDYEGSYKQLMAPIKANGRMVELRSVDDLRQLAQMGADYTRKMQQLAPQRKLMMMLQNHGLDDEGKLSYLIDLSKKDPEAIKKLVKDAGLDPLEIDTSKDSTYRAGNHRVSDSQVNFSSTLDDLASNEEGKATLRVVADEWDDASKEMLATEPGILTDIHKQRQNGVYAAISDEVARQRSLGSIPAGKSFLEAYKVIGEYLASQGKLDQYLKPVASAPVPPQRQAVATTTAAPKAGVSNGGKAAAASPPRSNSSNVAQTKVNPLAMSDDEFMKVNQFAGRV